MFLLLVSICASLTAECNFVSTGQVYDNFESCYSIGTAETKEDNKLASIYKFRCIKVR